MTQTAEQRALLDIANAWNELCPDADKSAVSRLVAEMKADGQHDTREHCRVAVGKLWDGLAYGNWPSVVSNG